MRLVVELPDEEYKRMVEKRMFGRVDVWKDAICNGTPLPEGAEILTAEAYSDLCLRASKERKTGRWISEIAEREDWKGIKRKYFQPNSCSVCHKPSNIGEDYPYCPNCGAKMKGAEE